MKQRPRLLFLLPLLAFVLVAGALVHPSSAHAAAASKVLKSNPRIFWEKGHAPSSPTNRNMIYHGGPVVAGTMKSYAIFWEPDGSHVSSTYNKLLKRYFRDVGGSPLYENNEQYTDTSSKSPSDVNLAGAWVDETPYPTTPLLTDADIQNEVLHAMDVNGWTPTINHAFYVYTALNEFVCVGPTTKDCSAPLGFFCAYHSAFGTVDDPVIYAAMPYDGNALNGCYNLSGSPNHDAAADAEISTTSHEQIEIATDPLFPTGWFGPGGGDDEIGDKCAYVYGPLNGNGANVTWDGHQYVVQSEWDNTAPGCVLSGPVNEPGNIP